MRKQLRWLGPDNGTNPTGGEPQAGDPPSNPTPQAGGTTTSSEPQAGAGTTTSQQKSADDYERMIADLRKENAGHRTKLKSFEDAEKQRQEAQLSEQQKTEKRLADLQKTHDDHLLRTQDRLVAAEVRAQAAYLNFVDPSDALGLLNRAELEYDDDGVPTNAKALLEKLLKAKSYLANQQQRAAPTSGGATNPPRSQSGQPQVLTWDVIGKMNAEEYSARRVEIQEFIRKNPFRYGQR